MSHLLHAANLSFSYGDRAALRDVSVSLDAGEVVVILGPNGSGKSPLIRTLLGHLEPQSGGIEWEGRPLRQWRRRELARRVAYLPQSPTADPDQSVRDVLRLGRAPYWQAFGIESSRDASVTDEVAAKLQLTDLLHRPIGDLSGGQRQRVFIGRCLAQEPAALLLDEPNTFLDLRHQVELLRLLRTLAREQDLGVLMASHDVNLAGAHADRMIVLHAGVIAAQGRPAEVLRAEVLGPVFEIEMEAISRQSGVPIVVPK